MLPHQISRGNPQAHKEQYQRPFTDWGNFFIKRRITENSTYGDDKHPIKKMTTMRN